MYDSSMTIESDLAELTGIIDQMLADIISTNIVETPKVLDFMLDARLIVERITNGLAEPIAV